MPDETIMGVFPTSNPGTDVHDVPSGKASVTKLDIFFTSFSILTHIVDVIVDLTLCARYLINGNMTHFYWTLAVLFIPSLINTVVSLRMYNQDIEMNLETRQSFVSRILQNKILSLFVLIFQLAPVLRHIDSLKYAIKSRRAKKDGDQANQRRYWVKMLKEDQDIALLRVFECFLEAAPQQILQITIMIMNNQTDPSTIIIITPELLHQLASVCSSLVSMGWAMANYNRSIRLAQWDKSNIGAMGTVLQFLWHFLITVSRIISISAVMSVCAVLAGIYCLIHWIAMSVWVMLEPSGTVDFCRDRRRPPHTPLTVWERISSCMFALVLGIVYIFIYLNPTDGSTFFRHSLYYTLCLIENVTACTVWTLIEKPKQWYSEFIIILCLVPFALGTISMTLYYKYFHPSTKVRVVNR